MSSISAVGRSGQILHGLLDVVVSGHDARQQGDGIGALLAGPVLGGGALAHIHSHLATWLLLGEEESVEDLGNTGPVLGNISLALSWIGGGGASGGDQDGNLLSEAFLTGQVLVQCSNAGFVVIT